MEKYAIKLADNSTGLLFKDTNKIRFMNENYNFAFNKANGFFVRWGKKMEDDGKLEIGIPEIADIEISTICHGVNGIPCAFCYKGNTGHGTYMTLDTFKKVFENLPPSITQIAFGIGDIDGNPDMWDIFDFCIDKGVTPNVTVNGEGITDEIADKLVDKCGAVAVSLYDTDKTYDTVKKLTDKGLKQTNIHFMLSDQTYERAFELMKDYQTDERLKNLNAIVLLSLKPKGRAESNFHKLPQNKFNELVHFALDNNIPLGFDSCGCYKFLKSIDGMENSKNLENFAEPCESTIYSCYINVDGYFFPCSFAENGNENGLSVIDSDNFLKDIWHNEKTAKFRKKVIECRNCKTSCSIFDV